jgi:hypothetical protein
MVKEIESTGEIDFLSFLPNIPASYGGGIGDLVIQTHLPKNIHKKYNIKSKVWCPNHFWDIWQYNPYVEIGRAHV